MSILLKGRGFFQREPSKSCPSSCAKQVSVCVVAFGSEPVVKVFVFPKRKSESYTVNVEGSDQSRPSTRQSWVVKEEKEKVETEDRR